MGGIPALVADHGVSPTSSLYRYLLYSRVLRSQLDELDKQFVSLCAVFPRCLQIHVKVWKTGFLHFYGIRAAVALCLLISG